MAYVSEATQREIIHDCFNGNQDRDCPNCPARFTIGGICCFGNPEKHNPDWDDDCQTCVFVHDCAEVVDDRKKRQEAKEIEREALRQEREWRRTPLVRPSTDRRSVGTLIRPQQPQQQREQLVQIGGLRPSVITPVRAVQALSPQETLFSRLVKDLVWGMGQGFFESGAHFMRTHRLP